MIKLISIPAFRTDSAIEGLRIRRCTDIHNTNLTNLYIQSLYNAKNLEEAI
jgi:hypothetical protein